MRVAPLAPGPRRALAGVSPRCRLKARAKCEVSQNPVDVAMAATVWSVRFSSSAAWSSRIDR